jgi:ribosome-binding protein aMBF1 (putative translation factor)
LEDSNWKALRERRMSEQGAAEAYHAARLAYELGRTVLALREQRGWSQAQLATAAGMTQSAVARFEAGGTVPSFASSVVSLKPSTPNSQSKSFHAHVA